MTPPPPSIQIAIPANNEADLIGACLAALADQQGAPPFGIVLLANNCTDQTVAIGRAWQTHLPGLDVVAATLPPARAHAGAARRLAMKEALSRSHERGVLLTTDADSRVPPGWIAANLAALAQGADAVAGRAVIDADEARLIPAHLHAIDAIEGAYAALLDEIAALLDPDPYDPWPRHDERSGASIAVRVPAYRAAGGIPLQATGEDRAFFDALRRTGARVRHAPEVWVTVSGRLVGRAQGGMADTIRRRLHHPPLWLDDRLEPLEDRLRRLRLGLSRRAAADTAAAPTRQVAVADAKKEIRRAAIVRDCLRAAMIPTGRTADPLQLFGLLASRAQLAGSNAKITADQDQRS